MDTMILLEILTGLTAWAIAEITTYLFDNEQKGVNTMTIDEILAVLSENGEQITIEEYDDFFIIEATNE